MKFLPAITKIAFVLGLTIIFTSCSKSDDNPSRNTNDYHLTLALDNQDKIFSFLVNAERDTLDDCYAIYVMGIGEADTGFFLDIYKKEEFKTGDVFTLVSPGVSEMNTLKLADPIQPSDPTKYWYSYSNYHDVESNLKITITEINNEFVKGTFSGKIYKDIENGPAKMVTKGSFKARFF